MSHTILLSDVIELITVNGEQYELDIYMEITGLTRDELISTAAHVEEHSVYSEDYYEDYIKGMNSDF